MAIQGDAQAIKKSNPAGLIFLLLSCGVIGWFGLTLYNYFQKTLGNLIVAVVLAIVSTLLIIAFFFAWSVTSGAKTQFLEAMPDGLQVLPATASEFPDLDTAEFERYTREFEHLGFQHLMDFKIDFRSGITIPGFARLMVHPTHLVYAEVNQVFPLNGMEIPVRCALGSTLTDGKSKSAPLAVADPFKETNPPIPTPRQATITDRTFDRDWMLGTTDRAADPILYIMRRRRSLWHRREGASPAELLDMHLKRREHMARHLKLTISNDLSRENYIARQIYSNLAMRRALINKNMLVGLWEMNNTGKKADEWWGDYAKYASRP